MKTFIFIGPSGSGKGTQVKNLMEHIEKTQENKGIFYIETGAKFRDFIKGDGYANKLSDEIYKKGARQPDFLAAYQWSQVLIHGFKGERHIIFDGTPRSLAEAQILDTAIDFFKLHDVFIIYIDVKRQLSVDRLTKRGRLDDNPGEIEKRLDWYKRDVAPAVEYYRSHKTHTFIEIDGGQTEEEVWQEIKKSL